MTTVFRRYTRDNVAELFAKAPFFRKKRLTQAVRVDGAFEIETREGLLECEDGYLALDSAGWPYPIAAEEFQEIYVEVPPTSES